MDNTWQLDRINGIYTITKKFDKYLYRVLIQETEYSKTIFLNIALTSGMKRKELEDYESVLGTPSGGIKALIWGLKSIEEFIELSRYKYSIYKSKDLIVTVKWIDSQRRRVYSRL